MNKFLAAALAALLLAAPGAAFAQGKAKDDMMKSGKGMEKSIEKSKGDMMKSEKGMEKSMEKSKSDMMKKGEMKK